MDRPLNGMADINISLSSVKSGRCSRSSTIQQSYIVQQRSSLQDGPIICVWKGDDIPCTDSKCYIFQLSTQFCFHFVPYTSIRYPVDTIDENYTTTV